MTDEVDEMSAASRGSRSRDVCDWLECAMLGEKFDLRLLQSAKADIERLRSQPCPYVTGTVTRYCTLTPFTLTDEEREAIVGAIAYEHGRGSFVWAATLRGLLVRTK